MFDHCTHACCKAGQLLRFQPYLQVEACGQPLGLLIRVTLGQDGGHEHLQEGIHTRGMQQQHNTPQQVHSMQQAMNMAHCTL